MSHFIAFEGVDGSGKTTMSHYAKQQLIGAGKSVVWTREPGGTEVAEQIRSLVLGSHNNIDRDTEILLFSAARCHHIKNLIQPAIKENRFVICDRFAYSTLAYQCLDIESMWDLQQWIADFNWMIWPDYTFYLKVSAEVAVERVIKRNGASDRMEQQFFERVSNMIKIYDELAENCENVLVIDANCNQKEVEESVASTLATLLE